MQRSVSVQRLRVPLDDVVPLHAQVDEASGLNLLSFSVENVMPRCLVLDCCNQLFVMSRWQSWSSITLSFKNKKKFWIIQWDKKNPKKRGDSWNLSNPWHLPARYDVWHLLQFVQNILIKQNLRWKRACSSAALNTSFESKCIPWVQNELL